MIQKQISDYVPKVTKQVNQYYKNLNLDIVFTEKEIQTILDYNIRNIFTTMKHVKDIHIHGYFKLFYSKHQVAKYIYSHRKSINY
jgi:hypothetical protein